MEKEKKIKAPKANWDSAAHTIYMDACVEEVRASNRGGSTLTDLGKANLVRKFNERSGRNYSSDQLKNRWDICRADYSVWKTLTQKASGIGRDEYKKTIAASDEWWALEIKANPAAAKFRYAPLPKEEKMREVFDACCVTNEHARVPIPTYQSGSSRFNMDDDSGCESHDVEATPRPKRAKSGKKMPCSYSPSPKMNEKGSNETVKTDALVRMVDLFGAREKRKGNSGEEHFDKMKWRIFGGIPRYKPEAQKMIVTACMCLHNFIRESKLHDEHFDKFDNDAYVQPPLPFTGTNALPPEDDGTMAATREAITTSLVP